jgi:alkanesulfonate monooxygenase SsuD/methylene tetrahydromethanopterin reductase-like flavin-dependent oxidoreductase (luciferase family)
MDMRNIHVVVGRGRVGGAVTLAVEAERLGFGGVWVPEGTSGAEAFSTLTAIALRTERVELGTGIVNPFARPPSTLVQSIATVADCAGGRPLNIGIGPSSRYLVENSLGVPYRRTVQRVRETIAIVRAAADQGSVDFTGEIFQVRDLRWAPPPTSPVRLFVGGLGPKMLAMTGECADGWLPIWPARRSFQVLREPVATAAAAAGRPMPAVAAYVYTDVGRDEDDSVASLRRTLAWYMVNAGTGYQDMFRRLGYSAVVDEVIDHWRAGRRDAARQAVPRSAIDDMCLVGGADTIAGQLDSLRDAGIDTVVLQFPTDRGVEQITRIIRTVAEAAGAPATAGSATGLGG